MYQRFIDSLLLYKGLPRDIYFIAIARFILGLGNFIIPFMVLLLTQKQGYSASVAGMLVMVITGTYMLGSLLGGKLSDSFGHKKIMVIGEFLGAIILIMCGFFADNNFIAPGLMFIEYFFIGLALPASNALVADHSTPKNRDAVMSLSYLAYNLGSGVGPVVAGYLFWSHTAWIYWGNGIAILVGIIIVLLYVKEIKHDNAEEISQLEKATDSTVWTLFKERPRLLVFGVLCTLLWFALNQMTMTSPLYLSHLFEKDGAVLFGQLMTFASIVVVISTPILMKMTVKQCELKSLAVSGGLFALGYTLFMMSSDIPMLFFAWLFLSVAEVLLLTKEGVYIANNSPSSHRGRISAVLVTIRNVGLMPTYMLIGAHIVNFGYPRTWGLIIAVANVATFFFWLLYIQQKRATVSKSLDSESVY